MRKLIIPFEKVICKEAGKIKIKLYGTIKIVIYASLGFSVTFY